jgi:hypothetical protein
MFSPGVDVPNAGFRRRSVDVASGLRHIISNVSRGRGTPVGVTVRPSGSLWFDAEAVPGASITTDAWPHEVLPYKVNESGQRLHDCNTCGRTYLWRHGFGTITRPHEFCSMKCRTEGLRVTLVCTSCGRTFRRLACTVEGKSHFCSKECRDGVQAIDRSSCLSGCVDGRWWIPLGRGLSAEVDECDYERLSRGRWHPVGGPGTQYAVGKAPGNGRSTVHMHRVIIDAPPDKLVDHIDCNGLNNTRANLRLVNHAENAANTKGWGRRRHYAEDSRSAVDASAAIAERPTSRASMYKGVCAAGCMWEASLMVRGKRHRLGRFVDEADAARAYDAAVRETNGGYGRYNFPLEGERSALVD